MRCALLPLLLAGCSLLPARPVEIDLTGVAMCELNGRRAPLPAERDGLPRLVQRQPGTLDVFVRLPERAELVFGTLPMLRAEDLHLSVAADGIAEAPLRPVASEGGWRARLRRLDGRAVRLRFENRTGDSLAWVRPRVVGQERVARPLLDPPPPTLGKAPVNVLLYVIDTLRADRLSLYGYARPTSPELERIARRGVVFSNAYAPGSDTRRSIPSLLASRLPTELDASLDPRAAPRTIAEVFRDAGYQTAAFQANFSLLGELGFGRGFATYDIPIAGRPRPDGPYRVPASALHERALAWLGERPRQPWFLWIQTLDVHDPYDAPAPFAGRWAAPGETKWLDPDRYDECVAYADHELGRLVDALGELGTLERTILVVTADHGESLGSHGGFLHGGSVFEELVRVPLVILLPWNRGGRRVEDVVSLLDLAPTLLDLAALPATAAFRGRSFARPQGSVVDPPFAIGFRPPVSPNAEWYAREGPWKLIMDDELTRLFDVTRDRDETRDVSAERPIEAAYLTAALLARLGVVRTPPPPEPEHGLGEAERKKLRDALRALGYVE